MIQVQVVLVIEMDDLRFAVADAIGAFPTNTA